MATTEKYEIPKEKEKKEIINKKINESPQISSEKFEENPQSSEKNKNEENYHKLDESDEVKAASLSNGLKDKITSDQEKIAQEKNVKKENPSMEEYKYTERESKNQENSKIITNIERRSFEKQLSLNSIRS